MTQPDPERHPTAVVARVLSPAEFDSWRTMLAVSRQGGIYGLPEYLEALCEATGATFRILAVFLSDELVGGVPLYERRTRSGVEVANRTLLYYNGVVLSLPPRKYHSDETSLAQTVLAALERGVSALGYAHVLLHNDATLTDLRPFLAAGWTPSLSYTYVVRLGDLEAQWERVDQNLRRLIRRCEREGVTYREDDDFDALFRLHLETHRRKGAPLYLPEAAFARYFRRLHAAGLARLGHAVLGGRVIASQLMLTGPGATSHTVCAGADEEFLRLGASAFLRWKGFQSLASAGYAANDLTDAALNPVTRFKSQLGGELTPTWSIASRGSRRYRFEAALRGAATSLRGRSRRDASGRAR